MLRGVRLLRVPFNPFTRSRAAGHDNAMLSNPPPTPGHTPGTRAEYARQDIAPGAAVPPLRAPPAGPAPGGEGFANLLGGYLPRGLDPLPRAAS